MAKVYFSLGSNQGDRLGALIDATKLIGKLIGRVLRFSPVVESEPWGFSAETTFYNQALDVDTDLTPHQVLVLILQIERELGRVRSGKEYISRVIDIDILFYDDRVINDNDLIIPHPLLHKRRFVLVPLCAMEPGLIHPVFGLSVSGLLIESDDKSQLSEVMNAAEFEKLLKIKTEFRSEL